MTVKKEGVTVTTHYPKSDKNKDGDYYDVTVDATVLEQQYHWEYGDSYHDKGREKAEGVVDALKTIYGKKFITLKISVADREDY